MTIAEFADRVATLCMAHGGSITSWGRTPAHNAAVGGVAGSPHTHWLGADVVYDGGFPDLPALETAAAALGLAVIREASHDHVQPLGWINKPVGVV